MSWTSAGWLAGLVPWAAVAAYLFTGTNRPVAVPFVHLWPRATGGARRRRGWRRPPVGLVLAAAGVAAAVVSAGGPGRRGGRLPVTVVLDRGATMCGAAGDAAYRGVVRRARATLGDAPARLVCVPAVAGGPTIVTDDWADRAASAPPTAADTAAALDAAVGDLLRSPGDGPIVVLTDRPLGVRDRRVTRLGPDRPRAGIGVTAVAARDGTRPQVMVRVRNRSPAAAVVPVRVRSAGEEVSRSIGVAPGATASAFVDVPALGPTVDVVVDPNTIDGDAFLARHGLPIRAGAAADAAEPLRRMAAVFDRTEGRTTGPVDVLLTDGRPPGGAAAVWVEDGDGTAGGSVTVLPHPVTADVAEWDGGSGDPVPTGFAVVVRRGGRAVVAVRDGPPRQVWADVDVRRWSTMVDWVVFLADAVRWVGPDRAEWTAGEPRRLDGSWTRVAGSPAAAGVEPGLWPGVYRSADGRVAAVNAAPAGAVGTTSGRGPSVEAFDRVRPLGGWCGLAAAGCLAAAAAGWPSSRGRGNLPRRGGSGRSDAPRA